MRREAQLAAMRYDEERQKNRSLQRDNMSGHAKVRMVVASLTGDGILLIADQLLLIKTLSMFFSIKQLRVQRSPVLTQR